MFSAGTAAAFELHHDHLRAVAYRMLGSVSEAEDAVQEAWIRLLRSNAAAIDNIGSWLTRVVDRVCLDMLRARKARRETSLSSWLPEPVLSTATALGPEEESLLVESVGLALLVVLDTLGPDERIAFVLHDTFAVPFDEIATVLDRPPDSARQLASRARRRIRRAPAAPDADPATQRRLVAAFLTAARAGDLTALIEVLNPHLVRRAPDHALR